MSFFSRMNRLFGRWVVLADCSLFLSTLAHWVVLTATNKLIYCIFKFSANACPTQAAAVRAVEEVRHRIDLHFILANYHISQPLIYYFWLTIESSLIRQNMCSSRYPLCFKRCSSLNIIFLIYHLRI
jgi:hypothetical protein